MLLIVESPGQRQARPDPEGQMLYQRMVEWSADLEARGLVVMGESLKPHRESVRVRLRDGKRSLVDGPFAEAKEMIGGFFLLRCETKDQAVAIASECPAAAWATVEVRELGACSA